MLLVTLSRGAFGAPGRRLFEIVGAVPRRQVFRGFFGGRSPFRDEWEIVLCLFLLLGHYFRIRVCLCAVRYMLGGFGGSACRAARSVSREYFDARSHVCCPPCGCCAPGPRSGIFC